MKTDDELCTEYRKFRKIDAAFRAGDHAALRAAVDDPACVPNRPMPLTIGSCVEYAIFHGPLPFIRTLPEICIMGLCNPPAWKCRRAERAFGKEEHTG